LGTDGSFCCNRIGARRWRAPQNAAAEDAEFAVAEVVNSPPIVFADLALPRLAPEPTPRGMGLSNPR
jgi:hypothetical protein